MPVSRLPRRPSQVSEHALACLQALVDSELAAAISIGGGFGLLHYLDHRSTKDLDAWWAESAGSDVRQRVVQRLERTLSAFGQVRIKAWGDVVSLKLVVQGKVVFGFEIASRSALLAEPRAAPWIAVPLDSPEDLLASKMVALIERGAPRDFHDLHAACSAGLTSPAECWGLWRMRQAEAGSDASAGRARLALETHIARIEQHRPLGGIPDEAKRAEALGVREWFRGAFLDALEED